MRAGDGVGSPDGAGAVVSRAQLYSCLVTRQTGRAVRLSIQEQLTGRSGPVVTVLDFHEVSVIDFSCADEVAAKLVDEAAGREDGREEELFLLFTGMEEHHLDPVESALRRRELVVSAERADGTPLVLGELDAAARRAWEWLADAGGGGAADVARALELDADAAADVLRALHRRRLVLRRADAYLSLRRAVARATAGDEAP